MTEPKADRTLTVVAAGPQLTVQDLGRPGHAHLGVPRSGALDGPALRLANRLVGNDEGAAGLEGLGGGVRLRTGVAMALAVTGAQVTVRVDGRAREWGQAVIVRAGSEVVLGTPERGLRCYVAVSGGLDVPVTLGSRSTDLLSGIGPDPVIVRPAVRAPEWLSNNRGRARLPPLRRNRRLQHRGARRPGRPGRIPGMG